MRREHSRLCRMNLLIPGLNAATPLSHKCFPMQAGKLLDFIRWSRCFGRLRRFTHFPPMETDIEQVLREKKSFTLRCILDGIKELQGRVVTWNRFASSVSITSACSLL